MIRVSIGTAGVLGLTQVPMSVAPTTAYLMVGGRCTMNCAFCAQARDSTASDLALSRVTWPDFPLDEVCTRLRQAEQRGDLRRCCIQVTAGREYVRRALDTVRRIRSAISMPLGIAILPANIEQVGKLFKAGVDRIGFGLDAACERVFRQIKGSHWEPMMASLRETARHFPGRAMVHLMVGLGETEREMVTRLVWAHDLRVCVGLFAFTPLRGTPLAQGSQPPLGQYRRMQAASWLISRHGARMSDFVFGDAPGERGTMIGIALADWPGRLADGGAFRTMGCPDCNRPFYNERPGGTMYNYPRPLTVVEARLAISQMEIERRYHGQLLC